MYTWRWNIPTNRVIVNKAFAHLFAVDPVEAATSGLPIELFLNAMHPEDRSHVQPQEAPMGRVGAETMLLLPENEFKTALI